VLTNKYFRYYHSNWEVVLSENLAILIGGIEYDYLPNLDCCENDVKTMENLLKATGRFSHITSLLNKNSEDLKEGIRSHLDTVTEAKEVLFYYTGHGYMQDDEFYFCAKDFSPKAPNRTGLSNKDLHSLIKGIKSETVIKIIDSCASGVNLIKSEIHPLKREEKFKNFIQIASCLDSQNSITGESLSKFTEAFISAAVSKNSGPVYYQDIISSLRDYFLENPNQTPHFVSQYTGRELFADDGSVFKVFRSNMESKNERSEYSETKLLGEEEIKESILSELNQLDQQFTNKEKAQSFIDNFQLTLETTIKSDKLLDAFFDLEKSEFDDYEYLEEPKQICLIIQKQIRYDNLVDARSERIKQKQSIFDSVLMYETKYSTNYYLSLNCSLSRVFFRIVLHPKFRSIKQISQNILFAPSLDKCFIFESIVYHPLKDWSEYQEGIDDANWHWSKVNWNKDPKEIIDRCAKNFIAKVKEHLQETSEIDIQIPEKE
jgi:hypothetical protein